MSPACQWGGLNRRVSRAFLKQNLQRFRPDLTPAGFNTYAFITRNGSGRI
jgi:hypothetical protein